MKKLVLALIIGLIIVGLFSHVSDLHSRIITLENDQEQSAKYIQELQEAVFEGENIIEIGPNGYMRLISVEN